MKTLVGIILLIVLNPAISICEGKYEKAMKDAVNKMNQATSVDDFKQVANQFDRISNVETDNWLPIYHAAYTRVMMAAMEQDLEKKDVYLDAAQLNLDELEKKEHDAVERMVLHGFLIMIRMSVDPTRGMDLGMECGGLLHQAYTMNSENPRAVLMLGQFKHGSAQYMGEDTSEACAMFEKTLQLLDQPSPEASSTFLPTWGKNLAMTMQQHCRE